MKDEYAQTLQMKFYSLEAFDGNIFSEPDIETIVQNTIDSLPEKCREIFILNKIEGKKQKDIAQKLHISINTIESQMAIAYKKLQEALKDYVPLFIFLLI